MRDTIGIDPGSTESGIVVWQADAVALAEVWPNRKLRDWLKFTGPGYPLKIEAITSFGMPVGAEVFETAYFIGRLLELWETMHPEFPAQLIPRREVKLFWCGNMRAKDPHIRQAIIDRFGGKEKAIGRKACPGPLYNVAGHCWSALAIALCEVPSLLNTVENPTVPAQGSGTL